MRNGKGLPWEEAAMQLLVVPIEGGTNRRVKTAWACKTCKAYYGLSEDGAEHSARFCCATNRPCQNDECRNRAIDKHHLLCSLCQGAADMERWYARPEKEWDGVAVLSVCRTEKYFFSVDDLEDHIADMEGTIDDVLDGLQLEICERVEPQEFCLSEQYSDDLPEDLADSFHTAEIDKQVNDFLKKHFPEVWYPTRYRASIKSLKAHLTPRPVQNSLA
ncbi:MAG: hypothetical protein ABI977_12975 [Acidobacteriota bacterium]